MQSRAAPTTRRLHTIASFTASASRWTNGMEANHKKLSQIDTDMKTLKSSAEAE